ncbi:DUF2232 domain-containing protein [Thiofilum flexile]|uniref:DUF2232 domain-containing protein n=1 Tax=Thiofilum flexile TaxID=125627 RepID=UPI00039D3C12|nr:DUF2232 domain-containing protein [Thiofilum flexile]
MSSRLHAIMFTLSMTLISFVLAPLGIFANAAVALVTLRLGAKQGLWVALPVTAGLTLIVMVLKGNALVGLTSGLVSWLPLVVLGAVLERTVSWTQVLQYLLAILAVLIIGFYVAVGNPAAVWEQWLISLVNYLPLENTEQTLQLTETMKISAPYMTGVLAALLGVHWMVSLMLGRYWQAQLYNPGGFQTELHRMRMSKPLALLMIALVGLRLFVDSALLTDLIIVGLAVFLFAGLSLVHYSVHHFKLGIGWLVAVYLLLIFTTPVIVMLATLGIIDSQADLRRFINTRKPTI